MPCERGATAGRVRTSTIYVIARTASVLCNLIAQQGGCAQRASSPHRLTLTRMVMSQCPIVRHIVAPACAFGLGSHALCIASWAPRTAQRRRRGRTTLRPRMPLQASTSGINSTHVTYFCCLTYWIVKHAQICLTDDHAENM